VTSCTDSDEQAFDLFRELRWGKSEEVICPECGAAAVHWFLPSRRQWRCKACAHTFSVTSGTIFAHHKLPLRTYLGAVVLYTNAVKGLSALQMGRDLGVQYKTAYVLLHAHFPMRRVKHQVEYRADDGTTNNQAESYFSRFRRMEIGQTHKFGTRYLANYANEAAYREDTRRHSNGEIFGDILTQCARTPTHRDWCGYWQGNKRLQERLAA